MYHGYSPFSHGAADNGCGRGGERQLEQEGGKNLSHQCIAHRWIQQEVPNGDEWIGEWAATEAHSVAEEPVSKSAQNNVDHVLHHDVHLVLDAYTTGLQHTETRLHGEDDEGGGQDPVGVLDGEVIQTGNHIVAVIPRRSHCAVVHVRLVGRAIENCQNG